MIITTVIYPKKCEKRKVLDNGFSWRSEKYNSDKEKEGKCIVVLMLCEKKKTLKKETKMKKKALEKSSKGGEWR